MPPSSALNIKPSKQPESCRSLVYRLHGLPFNTEDGGCVFLRNVDEVLPEYTMIVNNTVVWDVTMCSPIEGAHVLLVF
jgi:hypothetical protein